ncbi:hypothetical protein HBB16_13820 [Pseudonocardia sp. MCCB 268]|nr:hypothetical protein [Pseudonocardia cytotoxica]
MIFLLEGIPAVLLARRRVVLPHRPAGHGVVDAAGGRDAPGTRARRRGRGGVGAGPKSVLRALKSPQVLALSGCTSGSSTASALGFFLPTIIKGFSAVAAQLTTVQQD